MTRSALRCSTHANLFGGALLALTALAHSQTPGAQPKLDSLAIKGIALGTSQSHVLQRFPEFRCAPERAGTATCTGKGMLYGGIEAIQGRAVFIANKLEEIELILDRVNRADSRLDAKFEGLIVALTEKFGPAKRSDEGIVRKETVFHHAAWDAGDPQGTYLLLTYTEAHWKQMDGLAIRLSSKAFAAKQIDAATRVDRDSL